MYYDYFSRPNYVNDLVASGIFGEPATMSVWEETVPDNWNIVITVSGLYFVQPQYMTLHADIQDLYLVGEHKISSLQDQIRHLEAPNVWSDPTNISKWSRATFSGAIVGEIDDPGLDYPFDVYFSGMMRHFEANDGFWFGSTCVRFDATRRPYVAHADYPAAGEASWWETEWIQDAVDMIYVEKFDFGRILVSTTISGLVILDTEDTFASPYASSDLSAFTQTSGVIVTGLDTLRTY